MSDTFSSRTLTDLSKIGIDEPWELITNLPTSYDDFTKPIKSISAIMKLSAGENFYAGLILKNVKLTDDINRNKQANGDEPKLGGKEYAFIELTDGVKTETALSFSALREWKAAKASIGELIFVSGVVKERNGRKEFGSIELVPISMQGRLVARYRGKKGIMSESRLSELTKISLIHNMNTAVSDMIARLDDGEERALKLCGVPFNSFKHLLSTLHLPESAEECRKAIHSARALCAYQMVRKAIVATERSPSPESAVPVDLDLIKALVGGHKFTPTKGQKQAIWDIIQDLASTTPMDRLLSADVGNGKTLAYGIPAAYMSRKCKNTVILVPTEVLAHQVSSDLKQWNQDLEIHPVVKDFKGKVEQGAILVGTTALIGWLSKNPDWKVDLAITDEQQKLGSSQRESLAGPHTHILEATATPIPRTMAQSIFGHKKVSIIDDCPVEKSITTTLIGNEIPQKRWANELLKGYVEKGKKIIIIYPLVAEKKSYFYHVDAGAQKDAKSIISLLAKNRVSVKGVTPISDAQSIIEGADLTVTQETGFIAEIQAEEQSKERIDSRWERYLGEHAGSVTYLGSTIDDELSRKNKTTIMRGAEGWEKTFPGRVGTIHGRSSSDEKTQIIDDMNAGKYDVLIATTLVEIGINVKNCGACLVVSADVFGAYTLHQIRGRVVRDGGHGDFIMVASKPLEEIEGPTLDRLDLLCKFTRGDDIAMHDLDQRGFGDLKIGGGAQKGYSESLFPGVKLGAAELDEFLKEIKNTSRATRAPCHSPNP